MSLHGLTPVRHGAGVSDRAADADAAQYLVYGSESSSDAAKSTEMSGMGAGGAGGGEESNKSNSG